MLIAFNNVCKFMNYYSECICNTVFHIWLLTLEYEKKRGNITNKIINILGSS